VATRTDKCVKVTARVEADEPFLPFAAGMLLNFLDKSTSENSVLMLCRTIRDVYSMLRYIIKTGLQLVRASAVHRTPPGVRRRHERLPQVR
jgi:hypothetical protein